MSDFLVNIDSYLDLSKAETQMKNFLSKYNGEKLDIKVEINPTSINTGNLGKQLQTSFGKAMSSVSFDGDTFVKQYIAQMKKDMKEADKIASQYKIRPSQGLQTIKARNTAEEKAIQAVYKAQIKAEQDALKEKEQTQKKYYDKILSNVNEEYRLKNKLLTTSSENERKELNRQLKSTQQRIKYNEQQLEKKSLTDLSYVRKINDQKIKLDNDYRIKSIQKAETTAKQIAQIESKVFTDEFNAKLSIMGSRLGGYDGQDSSLLSQARQQAELYKTTLSDLKRHFDANDSFNLNDEEVVASFNTMNQAAKTFDNTMTQVGNSASKTLGVGVADRAANNVKKYMDENSKALKKYKVELEDLEKQYRNITTVAEKSNLDNQFKNLKAQISAEGLTGKNWLGELGRGFKAIGQFTQTYGIIQKVEDSIVNAVSELKEMDSILTEISKVSDMTAKQLKELGDNAFDYASKYGKNVTDYLEGVTEMNRSGFYGQQGVDLANISVLAQAAGGMTADVANSYLLATNAAYEYAGSAEKLNAVLDGQNMITNRNSVNMTDMASATTEAGSMAAQAGVRIDQLSALIGTAVSRTKKSGDEVGTALKSLFVNLQNTQNSKIVGTFESLGISMTEMVGDSEMLKTPIELLEELSDVYNSLSDGSSAKADILTNIGGKYHANVLSSILAGYSDYEKMLVDYSEGTGSAAVEAEKSANNWEGSMNKLSNSWTEFISNFADSGQITGAINLINGLVQALDGLVGAITPLGTIGLGAGSIAFFKNLDELKITSFA